MSKLSIKKLTATIGAEIGNIDLREPLDESTRSAVENALVEHHVIFFRDQDITAEEQIAFAKQFGQISVPPSLRNTARIPRSSCWTRPARRAKAPMPGIAIIRSWPSRRWDRS